MAVKAEIFEIPCGKHVTGCLDTSTGVLVISGKGPMWDHPDKEYFTPYQDYIYQVEIKEGVTTIGDYAFYSGFDHLNKVTIGKDVKTIGKRSFYQAESLLHVEIPGTVKEIRKEAFCFSGLTSCILNPGLEIIGLNAFADTKLMSISIPGTVKEIQEGAFRDGELTACILNPGLKVIGKYAFSGSCLTSMVFPNTLKEIKASAFRDIPTLTSCTFPFGLSVIGEYAFANTGLTSVTLPESLVTVETGSFLADSLTQVTIPRSIQTIRTKAFPKVKADVQSPGVVIENNAFGDGTYLIGDRGTTAEAYAWKNPGRVFIQYRQYQSVMYFDGNGGSVNTAYRVVQTESYYGALPSPKRRKYSFEGWYTQPVGGSKINEGDRVTSQTDFTVYAHWKKISLKACKKPVLKSKTRRKIRISLKKVAGASKYQIRCSQKSSMKSAKTYVTASRARNIPGLKSGKKYYVQARAYTFDSSGKKVYGPWSKKASVKVK